MTDVPPLLTKCCAKCGEWKDVTAFAKGSGKYDRRYDCRECVKKSRVNYEMFADEIIAAHPSKKCSRCGLVKPRSAFYYAKYSPSLLSSGCAECKNANRSSERTPEAKRIAQIRAAERRKKQLSEPKTAERERNKWRLAALRVSIAVAACKRLGIDLTKLAKEQYDAEQRAKQAEQGLHQDQGSPAEDLRTAEGRPGGQAGRRRTRSAGVVPGT